MRTTENTPAAFPFPPVLNVLQLAELIHKTPQSILADRSRAPHRLPPSCEPPGTKSPLWLLCDVLDWLRQYQQPVVHAPAPVGGHRRGRPTKVEQARRSAAAQEGGLV